MILFIKMYNMNNLFRILDLFYMIKKCIDLGLKCTHNIVK